MYSADTDDFWEWAFTLLITLRRGKNAYDFWKKSFSIDLNHLNTCIRQLWNYFNKKKKKLVPIGIPDALK